MPRRYTLRRRAEGIAETRRRILDAAIALYQERGIRGTTRPEVARRADVARGTVLNHFATPDELAAAVADQLAEVLAVPGPEILDGAESVEERLGRLSRALVAFYERSDPWYRIHAREGGNVPGWEVAEAEFFRRIDELMRSALGELGADPRVRLMAGALLHPGTLTQLRSSGLPADDTADLVTEVLVSWLQRRGGGQHWAGVPPRRDLLT